MNLLPLDLILLIIGIYPNSVRPLTFVNKSFCEIIMKKDLLSGLPISFLELERFIKSTKSGDKFGIMGVPVTSNSLIKTISYKNVGTNLPLRRKALLFADGILDYFSDSIETSFSLSEMRWFIPDAYTMFLIINRRMKCSKALQVTKNTLTNILDRFRQHNRTIAILYYDMCVRMVVKTSIIVMPTLFRSIGLVESYTKGNYENIIAYIDGIEMDDGYTDKIRTSIVINEYVVPSEQYETLRIRFRSLEICR